MGETTEQNHGGMATRRAAPRLSGLLRRRSPSLPAWRFPFLPAPLAALSRALAASCPLAQHDRHGLGHRWARAPCHHQQRKRIFRTLYTGNCMFTSCIPERWDLTLVFFLKSPRPQVRSWGRCPEVPQPRHATARVRAARTPCPRDPRLAAVVRTEQKVNLR